MTERSSNCMANGFRFVVIADSKGKDEEGINKKVLYKIMKLIKALSKKPEFIVILGDSVAGSPDLNVLKSQLTNFKEIISADFSHNKIIPVIGNHEIGKGCDNSEPEKIFANIYKDLEPDGKLCDYNNTVYYKDFFNARIIVLNCYHYTNIGRISDEQLLWLKEVSSEPFRHKILLIHYPAYPTGAHFQTSLDRYPDERDKLWSIIDENGIDIVISGHEHNYSRRLIDRTFSTEKYKFKRKIYQIIAGGGGEKLKDKYKDKKGVIIKPKAVHHFLIVDVDSNSMSIQAISIDGKTIDNFTI